MVKLLSITTIIVTSVLAFGAIGLGSFAMGQLNNPHFKQPISQTQWVLVEVEAAAL